MPDLVRWCLMNPQKCSSAMESDDSMQKSSRFIPLKSEEAPVQHTYDDCAKMCKKNYPDMWERATCRLKCSMSNSDTSQLHLPQPAPSDILKDIGDNFYSLADLVSIL